MKIPEITDGNLTLLSRKIRPLVLKDGELMCIEMPDLRHEAFSWTPTITEPATDIVEIAKIRTLHRYGYYGFFKPSVAEVIAQIPEEWIERTVAFFTRGPADAAEMNREIEALNAGFHVAETTLYGLNVQGDGSPDEKSQSAK